MDEKIGEFRHINTTKKDPMEWLEIKKNCHKWKFYI